MSQKDRILQHMEEHGGISPKEAIELYGCMRLGARIYDLKKQGIEINRALETGTNRYGDKVRYARYTLSMQTSKEG